MRKIEATIVLMLVSFGTYACSDDEPVDSGAAGGHSVAGSTGEGGASGSAGSMGHGNMSGMGGSAGSHIGGMGGATSGAPQPPIMKSAEVVEGGVHVVWENVTPDCEKIELLRNKDGGEFSVAYTLTGVAESQHDTQATGSSKYCYKARCLKGGMTSSESNEKCTAP